MHALHIVTGPWSARQSRQMAYIVEYTSDLQYIPGEENVVADALSRPNVGAVGEIAGHHLGFQQVQKYIFGPNFF